MVTNRRSIVFILPDTQTKFDDVSDDFFDLTSSEAQMLYKEFVDRRKELDDKPLTTSSMRSLEEANKISRFLSQYKYCIIRIQFPERIVLQGIFEPQEKFSQVIDFTSKHLKNPSMNFYLFTAPPKNVPDKNKTLMELKFAPAAKLYFGTKIPLNSDVPVLNPDLLQHIKTKESAEEEAEKFRTLKGIVEEEIEEDPKPNIGLKRDRSDKQQSSSSQAIGGARPKNSHKIPKWFRAP